MATPELRDSEKQSCRDIVAAIDLLSDGLSFVPETEIVKLVKGGDGAANNHVRVAFVYLEMFDIIERATIATKDSIGKNRVMIHWRLSGEFFVLPFDRDDIPF